jgi:thymidylate kinase
MSRPFPADPPVAKAYRAAAGPLVCELVGLPGAGKSTAAARIVQHLRAAGYACGDRRSLARDARSGATSRLRQAGFQVTHPYPLAAALRLGLSVRPLTIASVSRALGASSWAYGLSRLRQGGLERVVLDQGVVQELWSVTLTGKRWSPAAMDAVLRGVFGALFVPPALVYLDVGIDEAAARLRQRPNGSSRFDRMEPAEVRRLLSEREARLRQIFERAVTLTGARWCRIDGGRALDDVCADVMAFLDPMADA